MLFGRPATAFRIASGAPLQHGHLSAALHAWNRRQHTHHHGACQQRLDVQSQHLPHVSGRVRCVSSDSDDTALDGALRLLRLQPLLPLPLLAIENPPRRICQLVIGCVNMVSGWSLFRASDRSSISSPSTRGAIKTTSDSRFAVAAVGLRGSYMLPPRLAAVLHEALLPRHTVDRQMCRHQRQRMASEQHESIVTRSTTVREVDAGGERRSGGRHSSGVSRRTEHHADVLREEAVVLPLRVVE